jgi:hypothetical protein
MMRDPRTQIRSIHNAGIFDYEVFAGRDMWWWPSPRNKDPFYHKWDEMSKLEKCAWSWYLVNSTILELFKNIPADKIFKYRFEDMIKGKDVRNLCSFLGIQTPPPNVITKLISVKHSKTPTVVKDPLPPWPAIPQSQKKQIINVVGQLSETIGYGGLND